MLAQLGAELEAQGAGADLERLPSVQRWRRQVASGYADLGASERESDREVVREKWPLYRRAAEAAERDAAT